MTTLNTTITINPEIYIRDPKATDLGKKILGTSIELIDKYGLEEFNFKKLARKIGSTESSIYRYFENKHYLFIYLINWYWEWTSTRIEISTLNMDNPIEKVKKIIHVLTTASFIDLSIPFIDETILHRIILRDGKKAYHHKTVDSENEYGFFLSYKTLCKKISLVFLEINQAYRYPKALASTLVEACNNNLYFAKHLPRLTDFDHTNSDQELQESLFNMMYDLVISNLRSGINLKDNHTNILLTQNA